MPFLMKPFGIGIDIVEITRFRTALKRQGEAFMKRIFVADEIAHCTQMKDPAPCMAARFAVKEAVSKALGTGIGEQLGWHDIEVRRKVSGEPYVVLHGTGDQTAKRLGITGILISISHSENYAVANAVAFGG